MFVSLKFYTMFFKYFIPKTKNARPMVPGVDLVNVIAAGGTGLGARLQAHVHSGAGTAL